MWINDYFCNDLKQLISIHSLFFLTLLLIVGYFAPNVLVYIIVGGVFTFLAQPFRRFWSGLLEKKKQRSGLVAGLSMLTLIGVLSILFLLIVPLIVEEAKIIASIDTQKVLEHLRQPISDVQLILEGWVETSEIDIGAYAKEKIISILSYSNVGNFIAGLSSLVGDFFIALFSISFITFFFLKDQYAIISFIERQISDEKKQRFIELFKTSRNLLKRYIIGITLEVLLIIAIVSLGCFLLGVKNALMIGFFAGIFNVIPYVGPLIGLMFGLIIGLTTELNDVYFNEAVPALLKIGGVIVGTQVLDNILFQPLIYSTSVKAHPLEIFLVILIAGNIFGIGGMVLAVPFYTVLRLLVKEYWQIID